MPCCTNENNNCRTCGYSIYGDMTCYSPLIRLDPPQDAEWVPRDGAKNTEQQVQADSDKPNSLT